ncbi:glycosyltransferase family 39 protein [Undibacterium luofuense]|uniref:Glycosyltransferase family 39 protein n=1 Tax=Undibacterium luofuense TaxID=2828733 RepID=A0A941DM43_9BURK|nr:glycosyltransferase family 39 protein [Undibacterium luofuense]MBR7782047.1 glycosyltransferase family 39 protein [Undibacterium luofuense]
MKRSPFESTTLVRTLTAAFLLFWFYMLGARVLVPTDEGRYAEMAREMLATGDWITLRLNGIKYFEKPPLQNWMNALTFALFGLGEWQARLWTGLTALLGIVSVGFTAAKLYDRRTGWIAALMLGSGFYWAGMGHVNSLDMGISGFFAVALCALILGQRDGVSEKEQRNYMLLCWAAMALATLSKGLIGIVLPGAVLTLYTLLARDLRMWTKLHFGKGLLLFFAITAPWFILIAMRNPEHPHFFFIHEHFDRFTSGVHKRGGPWYYFIPLMVLGILPWLGYLFSSVGAGWKKEASRFQPLLMAWIWAVFFFVFFSVSGSKLPGYIVPIFPALALIGARQAAQGGEVWQKISLATSAILGIALTAGVQWKLPSLLAGKPEYEIPLYQGYAVWLQIAGVLFLLAAVAGWVFLQKQMKDWSLLALGLTGFIAGQIAFLGHNEFGKYIAGTAHLPAMREVLKTPGSHFYGVGRYEQAMPFYVERTMTLVEFPDEMQFGLSIEPQLWIPQREDFVHRWLAHVQNKEAAVAVVRRDIYDDFRARGIPMRVIGDDPKRIVISAQ